MFSIIKREIVILLHQRKMILFVLMAAASAYSLLLGNLYGGHTVQHIPVAVCDMDNSQLSRGLIKSVGDADQYELTGVYFNQSEALAKLEERTAAVVLLIPADFSRSVHSNQPVKLGFYTDGTNSLQQSYTESSMQRIAGAFGAEIQNRMLLQNGITGLAVNPVMMSLRLNGNPVQSYAYFYLYGVMLTAGQIGLLVSFGISMHSDMRKKFSFQHGVVRTILLKELVYGVMSMTSIMVGFMLLIKAIGLPYNGEILTTFLLLAAFIFCVMNFSGLLAVYFKTETCMVQSMVLYTLPAFLLSGYIWPEEGMLPIIKCISYLLPVHYVLVDFRSLALNGVSAALLNHLMIMLVSGMVGLICIITVLKKRAKHYS